MVNEGAAMTFTVAVLLVKPVPPCVELIVPVVFSFAPSVVPCTVTIIVQFVAALSVAPLRVMRLAPFAAVSVPPQLLVGAGGFATTKPAGRLSVKRHSLSEVRFAFRCESQCRRLVKATSPRPRMLMVGG